MRFKARQILRRAIVLAVLATLWVGGMALYRADHHRRHPQDPINGFLISPYLQIGDNPKLAARESAEVLWHTFDIDDASTGEGAWSVELQTPGETPPSWRRTSTDPVFRRVAIPGIVPHRVYRTPLRDLTPGAPFTYRVVRGEKTRFEATGHARPGPGGTSRAVIVGDFGNGSSAEARVADRTWRMNPDYLVFTGDLVYWRGRIFEYERQFFPYLNASAASPHVGAPLLRSFLTLAAPGNHDLMTRDLVADPDAQAFFYYWSMPLNGPVTDADAPGSPNVKGSLTQLEKFREASGAAYPRMANFSADVGDVHWTVIDLNAYVDWTDPALLAWLEADLAAARSKPWRLVAGHHPGFQSGNAHRHEQQMRQLAPIFERNGVAIVFAGHVHNYQRTRPLRFNPRRRPDGKFTDGLGKVEGDFQIDRSYDGLNLTVPQGVIYVVTGAGGASLHNTDRLDQEANRNDFTIKFISGRYGLTVMDVSPNELKLVQISESGETLDAFNIRRAVVPAVAGSSTNLRRIDETQK